MSNITLKKISEVLNLNVSTVSRALKNHPDISEKTKKRVRELANTLDYEPNLNAISLRTNDSRLLGVIVPAFSILFYNSFITALEEACRKNDFLLLLLQSGDDPAIELDNLKLMKQNRISGLFFCISPETENIEDFVKLKEKNIPVIFFDKIPPREECCKVTVADEASAELAANTILESGKKKILSLFGSPKISTTKIRKAAFENIIATNGADDIEVVYAFPESISEAEIITSKNFAFKPDVVFCMTDDILIGAMSAIQKNEMKVPDEISVIAISNGFIPTLYYPAITYIETSGYKLGKLAFESMMRLKAGEDVAEITTTDTVLVRGGSI